MTYSGSNSTPPPLKGRTGVARLGSGMAESPEPLHWRAKRDRKAKMPFLQSFPRKGVSLGYVGVIKT